LWLGIEANKAKDRRHFNSAVSKDKPKLNSDKQGVHVHYRFHAEKMCNFNSAVSKGQPAVDRQAGET
jgi:hypothetical protein